MKFKQWIDDYCINIHAFARKTGISRSTLIRLMNDKKTTWETARQICKFTEEKVTMEDFGFSDKTSNDS